MAPKTRLPVEVFLSPTSRKTLKGRPASWISSVMVWLPSGSLTPSYFSARPILVKARRATRSPVAYAAAQFLRPCLIPYFGNSDEYADANTISPCNLEWMIWQIYIISQGKVGWGSYNCGICESYYEPVFRCSITVLGLSDETFSRIIIGFAFSTIHDRSVLHTVYWVPFSLRRGCRGIVPATTVFCLVAREVRLALDVFDEGLATSQKSLDKVGYIYHCAAAAAVV